ncbi:MAG: alpha/beta fold hydrolase [Myxococcaceae bacterium]
MTEPTRLTLPTSDSVLLAVFRWDPKGAPKGIVQLTHGMGEHVRRYAAFAEALNQRGYVVYGQDHRGHGASVKTKADLGKIGDTGWRELIADIGRVTDLIRKEQPKLPLALFAHSMGSFAAQQYLIDHSNKVDAVVLTGTAALDLLEPALDLNAPLSLEAFNAPFQPARTGFDWLSRDNAEVDKYVADPFCGFSLDVPASKALFAGARRPAKLEEMTKVRKDLPLLIAVGDADPVNGGLALYQPLLERYKAAGLKNVSGRTYPGARHELLNETNRAEITNDLVNWIDQHISASDERKKEPAASL